MVVDLSGEWGGRLDLQDFLIKMQNSFIKMLFISYTLKFFLYNSHFLN